MATSHRMPVLHSHWTNSTYPKFQHGHQSVLPSRLRSFHPRGSYSNMAASLLSFHLNQFSSSWHPNQNSSTIFVVNFYFLYWPPPPPLRLWGFYMLNLIFFLLKKSKSTNQNQASATNIRENKLVESKVYYYRYNIHINTMITQGYSQGTLKPSRHTILVCPTYPPRNSWHLARISILDRRTDEQTYSWTDKQTDISTII